MGNLRSARRDMYRREDDAARVRQVQWLRRQAKAKALVVAPQQTKTKSIKASWEQ